MARALKGRDSMNDRQKEIQDSPGMGRRFKALFFDWLFVSAYLVLLLLVTLAFYFLVWGKIPRFTNAQAQLVATFTSIVPIILIFSIMEGSGSFASWGKRKTKLKVIYKDMPLMRSLVRNTLKFLPWQFGHMSTINGIYTDFGTPFSMAFFSLSMVLPLIYVLMASIRKDHRHLADLLAGSQVVAELRSNGR